MENNQTTAKTMLKQENDNSIKDTVKNTLNVIDAGLGSVIDNFKNLYGEIEGTKAFELAKSSKLLLLDFTLSYDKNKDVEHNIAHYVGNFIQGASIVAVGAYFGSGILVTTASTLVAIKISDILKENFGFELGNYAEKIYDIVSKEIGDTAKLNTQELEGLANMINNGDNSALLYPKNSGSDYNDSSNSVVDMLRTMYLLAKSGYDTTKLLIDKSKQSGLFDKLVANLGDFVVNGHSLGDDTANISLYDPIALDLNANGKIDTLSIENGVFFDHNGDDIAFKSSWISGEDGILARDINGYDEINSGAELFGNKSKSNNHYSYTNSNAKDGFEALKEPDSNNDGIISNLDENFDKLQIWQDSNSNGVSETNELKSLSELGIESLNLNKFTNLNLLVA